ncbi:MAG TPA: dihydrofolate reductase family protein [Propionibacteriaceae bacterium]|nr:dihydrofolate reductase family protein [Propionibacteriaceae bacterium]
MRRLGLVEFVSVDGVMQGLAGPEEGFPYGGWGNDYPVVLPDGGRIGPTSETTAYLFGSRTYDHMAAFWPHQPDSDPMAAHLNSTQKYVVSTTREDVAWDPTILIRDHVLDRVAALKTIGDGSIVVLGSGRLARSLLAAGLVDDVTLLVHPLLLGTGRRLFEDLPEMRRLRLESHAASELGTLVLTYSVVP